MKKTSLDFLQALETDAKIRARVEAVADLADGFQRMVGIAREAGYSLDPDELSSQLSGASDELDEAELERVAGGLTLLGAALRSTDPGATASKHDFWDWRKKVETGDL